MLVIRRRAGESFVIGDNVEVEVLEIAASQVKIGIRAPREVPVLRKEIQVTAEQNRSAVNLPQATMDSLMRNFRPINLGKIKLGDRPSPREAPPSGRDRT
jgi:carbon storage regulator